jgi:hypothetical protein
MYICTYQTETDTGTSDIGLKRAKSAIISDIGFRLLPVLIFEHLNVYVSVRVCVDGHGHNGHILKRNW